MKDGTRVAISEIAVTFSQDGDSIEPGTQTLTIMIQDAGGGPFLILETDRWAVDSEREMNKVLGRVERLAGMMQDFNGE